MRNKSCSAKEFLSLILEHRPEILRERSFIGSFDWKYCEWLFTVGEIDYWYNFNHSAHADPNLPALLIKLEFAKHEEGNALTGWVIRNPADIIESETT